MGSLKCGDVSAFDGRPDIYSGNQGVALSVLNPVQRKISAETLKEKLTVAFLREARLSPVAVAA